MKLPKINKVVIENFSLYKLQSRIEIQVPDGVLCLVGANGLGKSTFISIVSYAMTGVVVPPDINFKSLGSIPAFVQKASGFYANYFEGRVEQRDRELSQVTVEFTLGTYTYIVTRNFFDSSYMPYFSRYDAEGKDTVTDGMPLLEQFNDFFIADAELSSFDQYIFIQAYVMTFDESKKLLFWDEDVMNRLMYLFFSIKTEDAQRADILRKNIKRYESNMRNIQWNISQMEKRLSKLRTNGAISEEEMHQIATACNEEDHIRNEIEETASRNKALNSELAQLNLTLDSKVLAQHALRKEYQQAFDSLYSSGVSVHTDENVQESLKRIIVALSENEAADISGMFENMRHEIVDAIKRTRLSNEESNIKRLKELDRQMQMTKAEEMDLRSSISRKEQELQNNQKSISKLLTQLDEFRKANEPLLKKKDSIKQSAQVRQEIQALEVNIENRRIEKKENEDNRNASAEELTPLESQVRSTFAKFAKDFIPVFRSYAQSFIGLDLDVELKDVSGMVSLVINVNGSDRRSRFQLSESQQYFLDIALRFSLIEFSKSSTAFMLIDTPEGSLDIAYESRAGRMFADFVDKGFGVIMTANINTSQLLLKLAEKCGKDKMRVERMTEWTVLTKVQQEEQEVIEKAYTTIEDTLNDSNA